MTGNAILTFPPEMVCIFSERNFNERAQRGFWGDMIKRFFAVLTVLMAFAFSGAAMAQQTAWIQIEAQPTLRAAEQSVRGYEQKLDQVNGFRLPGGWYAIALGPFSEDDAAARMRDLKSNRSIPRDSFVAFSNQYRQQFWPIGANALNAEPITLPQANDGQVIVTITEEEGEQAMPAQPVEETKAQARASERSLDRDARKALQVALQWEGFYNSGIDGAFGPGTRRAMADYQTAKGYDPTGILTTRQRAEVLAAYQSAIDSLGLASIRDEQAGIEIIIPANMVEFDRYEAPFAHYEPINDSGVRVILISQTGDRNTLYGLYDIMQTLEIVPMEGPRERKRNEFTLSGADDSISSYTYAKLVDGAVKGFTLIWPAGSDRRRDMAIAQMKASFASIPGVALADDAGLDEATQSLDLLSGLEIRRPDVSRSGFYVSAAGAVLTTAEAVANCQRITLDDVYDAEVSGMDTDMGLAILKPIERLAPLAVAKLATREPRLQSEIAVAGYPFEGRLSAPTLTFGTLAELQGLAGEPNVARLTLNAQAGDTGGPVLDASGAVVGMLLARPGTGERQLPAGVNFAAKAGTLASFLAENGIDAQAADAGPALHPVAISALATDMTVLVSCWN